MNNINTENKPLVHLFKTTHNNYVYDVNINSIARISNDIYRCLQQNDYESAKKKSVYLVDNGFFGINQSNIIIEHPLTGMVEAQTRNNVELLILQVTQNCNFRCQYCVYSGSYINRVHTNKRMTLAVAKAAVDFYYLHSKNIENPQIGFYGGEPLLEFALIRDVVDYSKKLFEGRKLAFNMTTNASLLDLDVVEFLNENNFNLTISLDGPQNIHDANRKLANGQQGTFDIVMNNLENIKKKYPDFVKKISFNAVLDNENNFTESSTFFSNDFFSDLTITATNVSDRDALFENTQGNVEFQINYGYEVFKCFLASLNKIPKTSLSKLIVSNVKYIQTNVHDRISTPSIRKNKFHPSGPCTAGVNRLFVNVEGDFFPCERVNEKNHAFNIGNINNGFSIDKIKSLLNVGQLTENECKKCWAINFCNNCAADIGLDNGLSREKRLERCYASRKAADEMLKEYCTLREYGYKFDED